MAQGRSTIVGQKKQFFCQKTGAGFPGPCEVDPKRWTKKQEN